MQIDHPSPFPIADLHCDVLSYLARVPGADWQKRNEIGAGLPHLKEGGVKLQVMALYTATKPGSVAYLQLQTKAWKQIEGVEGIVPLSSPAQLDTLGSGSSIGIVAAIENASGLCEENEPLNKAWERLDALQQSLGPMVYISFTHHDENRFGGGNYSNNIGLKSDGKALLEQLEGRNLAVDLAHASDQLAFDIFTYLDKQKLSVPVIASHSNFRSVWNHVRNLPLELTQELIVRDGLIGINFVRSYVDDDNPDTLLSHIAYGHQLGASNNLAFGADFFYTQDFPDRSRLPLFHPSQQNSSYYPHLLTQLQQKGWAPDLIGKMTWTNVRDFLHKLWG